MADDVFPDRDMDHRDKIVWIIEENGWVAEPVAPITGDEPRAGYTYTIGFESHFGQPETVIFGLTGVAARGLLGLIADQYGGGVELPIGSQFIGLLEMISRPRCSLSMSRNTPRCSPMTLRSTPTPGSGWRSSCGPTGRRSSRGTPTTTSACGPPNRSSEPGDLTSSAAGLLSWSASSWWASSSLRRAVVVGAGTVVVVAVGAVPYKLLHGREQSIHGVVQARQAHVHRVTAEASDLLAVGEGHVLAELTIGSPHDCGHVEVRHPRTLGGLFLRQVVDRRQGLLHLGVADVRARRPT